MSTLLYCKSGVVFATHDSSQNIPASSYGSGTLIVPWVASMGTVKVGDPAPTLTGAGQLSAYASTKASLISGGGTQVNVGTQQAPQMVEASTDSLSLSWLNGANTIANQNGSASFTWVESNLTTVTLTSAQVITIFNAVHTFLQSVQTTLGQVLAAIGGTVTTQAQVDTPPSPIPAWPVNS